MGSIHGGNTQKEENYGDVVFTWNIHGLAEKCGHLSSVTAAAHGQFFKGTVSRNGFLA
jgi:hypothetical protein